MRLNVRHGPLADIRFADGGVRFTLRADVFSVRINVCKVP